MSAPAGCRGWRWPARSVCEGGGEALHAPAGWLGGRAGRRGLRMRERGRQAPAACSALPPQSPQKSRMHAVFGTGLAC